MKNIWGWILGIGSLLAMLYALVTRNQALQRKLTEQQARAKLEKSMKDQEKANEIARKAEDAFNKAYDEYIAIRSNTLKRDS